MNLHSMLVFYQQTAIRAGTGRFASYHIWRSMTLFLTLTAIPSSGNPMLKVRLDLQGADGSVFDNLVISEKAMFKLVTFFESIGLKKKGEPISVGIGELADRAVNCEGRCKIKHEEYNGKINAKVDKYLVPTAKKAAKAPKAVEEEPSFDDVPFEID